jgi:hypothetical protein
MENAENAKAGDGAPRQYPVIDSVCEELKQFLRSLEPPAEAVQHFHNARLEMLKGMRELIDRKIEHLNRHTPQQGQKINVE